MNINILDFLMENDIILKSNSNGLCMTADEAFELGGEFVVYNPLVIGKYEPDVYRGLDFDKALQFLNGTIR